MTPQLHELLSIQGRILESFLHQNLGERYAYVILVTPQSDAPNVAAISNLVDRGIVEPVAVQLADRLTGGMRAGRVVEIGGQQAEEVRVHRRADV